MYHRDGLGNDCITCILIDAHVSKVIIIDISNKQCRCTVIRDGCNAKGTCFFLFLLILNSSCSFHKNGGGGGGSLHERARVVSLASLLVLAAKKSRSGERKRTIEEVAKGPLHLALLSF